MNQSSLKLKDGFTLIELLVSVAVLSLIMVILLSITNQTSDIWRNTIGKIEAFREARKGFESITRRLSQATLNTYWDYDDYKNPTKYLRQSELRFISGPTENLMADVSPFPAYSKWMTHAVFFQAPLGFTDNSADYGGLENLLNTWGYYIQYGTNPERPSFGLNDPRFKYMDRERFRLMEMMEPTEKLTLYQYTSGDDGSGKSKSLAYIGKQWFTTPLNTGNNQYSHVLSENILALILLPKLSKQEEKPNDPLAPDYLYDSGGANTTTKNQLPPLVQVTLIAIDEGSAGKLESINNGEAVRELVRLEERLFKNVGDINSDHSQYNSDLEELESFLISRTMNYRVFTTDVSIRGAKWSRN